MEDDLHSYPNFGPPAPSFIDVHVGKRLLSARSNRGMTREAAAEALGISLQQLRNFEEGTTRVGGAGLSRFAHVFGVSPTFFFEGLEDTDESSPPP